MLFEKVIQIIILFIGGLTILRFAGKKSISQMTFPTLVLTLSFGSLLIQPIKLENDVFHTLVVISVMVLLLISTEWLELKFNVFERFSVGHAITLVANGELQEKNLTKSRVTIDQLEMFLRQKAVKHYSDCEYVTLEPNGQIGYVLKKENQPLTTKDFNKRMREFETRINIAVDNLSQKNAFKEVSEGKHSTDIEQHLE